MIKDLYRREPVAIVTTLLILIQAVVEATTVAGYTWQSLAISATTALLGVAMRQSVYAPNTHDRNIFRAKVDMASQIQSAKLGNVPVDIDPRTNP